MTCKECLYYEACEHYNNGDASELSENAVETKCPIFKDKSRYIEIPCKKGDKMYCDGKHFADHCAGEVMSFPVDIILTEVCSTHRGEIDMVFDFERFGKDVFLTREEAEKALAERRKND